MKEIIHSLQTKPENNKTIKDKKKKKKGTDEQAIKASVGQKRDREPLRS
jgi:hypothetical protein